MTTPLHLYIIETDPIVMLSLCDQLYAHIIDGACGSLPPEGKILAETDIVILDPRIFPEETDPTYVVLNVWKRFPARVQMLLHTDRWVDQDYRKPFRELGVTHGFLREDYKRLFAILTKLVPTDDR